MQLIASYVACKLCSKFTDVMEHPTVAVAIVKLLEIQ